MEKKLKTSELKYINILKSLVDENNLIDINKITGYNISILYGYKGGKTGYFNSIKTELINKNILIKFNDDYYQLNSDNLQQDNLSQESYINTPSKNKVSLIEEKEPLNENQVITLNDTLTVNTSIKEINNENPSTDIENLQQEELSQENNINAQEEKIVAVNEEKQPIIKERFQDYVNEFIESDEYDKLSAIFNKLLLDIKYDYPTVMIKKVYYEVKNRYVNSNGKLERLVKMIDVIIAHFKLQSYFDNDNIVENSIDYILKDNYTENCLIRFNPDLYKEEIKTKEKIEVEKTNELIDKEKELNTYVFDTLKLQDGFKTPTLIKSGRYNEIFAYYDHNRIDFNDILKINTLNITQYSTESLLNYYITFRELIRFNTKLLKVKVDDDDIIFKCVNKFNIDLNIDSSNIYVIYSFIEDWLGYYLINGNKPNVSISNNNEFNLKTIYLNTAKKYDENIKLNKNMINVLEENNSIENNKSVDLIVGVE